MFLLSRLYRTPIRARQCKKEVSASAIDSIQGIVETCVLPLLIILKEIMELFHILFKYKIVKHFHSKTLNYYYFFNSCQYFHIILLMNDLFIQPIWMIKDTVYEVLNVHIEYSSGHSNFDYK